MQIQKNIENIVYRCDMRKQENWTPSKIIFDWSWHVIQLVNPLLASAGISSGHWFMS